MSEVPLYVGRSSPSDPLWLRKPLDYAGNYPQWEAERQRENGTESARARERYRDREGGQESESVF